MLPAADAIEYMKAAAEKSYAKKGQSIVEANWKAIDAGATAYRKFEVPADWATAEDKKAELTLEGREAIVKQVKELMEPINRMDGDSLPVSKFMDVADGQWELGASAYEKRGVAVMVPHWDETKCIQCNQCSFVCPHATIRPIVMNAEEQAAAPENMRRVDLTIPKAPATPSPWPSARSTAWAAPTAPRSARRKPSPWFRRSPELDQAPVWDYAVNKVSEKTELVAANVKGSQYAKPYLEFSGSCAGCAETAYARLVTQVCGDRMFISNATGCSSIWGNPAATSPFTVNACGHGPA